MGLLSRYLLDTHTLLWAKAESGKLPLAVRTAMADPANTVFVSTASAYEIALKNRTGKLPGVEELVDGFSGELAASGLSELPITLAHAIAAGRLDLRHKNPFDRLLIAQALIEDLILLSNEWRFDSFGVRRLW